MYNSESVRENQMHKLLRDFVIQTDHLIYDRRPDLMIVKRKKEKREHTEKCTLSFWLTTVKLKGSEEINLAR